MSNSVNFVRGRRQARSRDAAAAKATRSRRERARRRPRLRPRPLLVAGGRGSIWRTRHSPSKEGAMYRNGVRLLFTLCVGASALSLAPAARAGVLVAVDAVNGVETGFQQDAGGPGRDLSQFAGLLTGQLTGVFTADVFHAPNPSIVGTSAAVTGATISVSNLFASTALTGS